MVSTAGLSTFDPAADTVAHVTLVDTTTTNTDMVPAPLDAAGVRTAVGLATANLDTQLGDLPTAAENRTEMDNNSARLATIAGDTGTSLPATLAALNDITAAELLTATIEGSIDLAAVLRIFLAYAAGPVNGGGTSTIHYRDQADSKDRIIMSVDASGNRSSVTVDGD
jgi:hypothetical protein